MLKGPKRILFVRRDVPDIPEDENLFAVRTKKYLRVPREIEEKAVAKLKEKANPIVNSDFYSHPYDIFYFDDEGEDEGEEKV